MRTNLRSAFPPVHTHEGAVAQKVDAYRELKRTLMTCLLWEDTFYEKGDSIAQRIADLVPKVDPQKVAHLAVEAREKMFLRHAPLWLVRQLARVKAHPMDQVQIGTLVAHTLEQVIQRADELGEFVSLYWKEKKEPLSAGVKRGLAAAFRKFDAYALGKYNRDNAVKLRDVLFLCHAKPKDTEQAFLWKKLVEKTLESPDTWEVELSAGKDKRETFERLLREKKLGGLAVLRNLRNMQQAGVDDGLIRERLEQGARKALPFRFVAAARYAPTLESAIEAGMFKAAEGLASLPGKTGLLIDVSGSMDGALSSKSEMTRIDAAAGLAILVREKCERARVATFSERFVEIPARRGFALRDAIASSQGHSGTYLREARARAAIAWKDLDRLILITDEQAHDGCGSAFTKFAYAVNVGNYQHGLTYGNGWTHIDGFSERILDYVREYEAEMAHNDD
jgi:hypothetical protein